jgi:hypothetical protein
MFPDISMRTTPIDSAIKHPTPVYITTCSNDRTLAIPTMPKIKTIGVNAVPATAPAKAANPSPLNPKCRDPMQQIPKATNGIATAGIIQGLNGRPPATGITTGTVGGII